jgi:hypothetical protein
MFLGRYDLILIKPVGKQLITFIDDLNMPVKDLYGTQQPIAFLKLLIEKGGFYDRSRELGWKFVKDLSFLAAMGTPGGGRNVKNTCINIRKSILGLSPNLMCFTPRSLKMKLLKKSIPQFSKGMWPIFQMK